MEILFENVNSGAIYQEKIYDFWIHGKTSNGKSIVLYDDGFDLRKYEGKVIKCLILAFMAQKINPKEENKELDPFHPIINGQYMGEYEVPEEWSEYDYDLNLEGYHGVQTKDGVFLLEPTDLQGISIEKGEEIIITVGRLDLLAWLPID
ncbi:MAG: hypothetical protein P8Y97_17290 [Candidatus Lokiarchaeota archaeon]